VLESGGNVERPKSGGPRRLKVIGDKSGSRMSERARRRKKGLRKKSGEGGGPLLINSKG